MIADTPPGETGHDRAVRSGPTQALGLQVCCVTKAFGPFKALDRISLALEPGELVSILGPSGCGKSTLLRVIAGLDDPDAGEIRIGAMPMRGVSPKDRGVAFVFQNYALYPNLTVRDNIAAPLVMRELRATDRLPVLGRLLPGARARRESIRSRVSGVARLLRIEPYLGRKPAQLSGGQRQRVALGRALIREPKLFLLDEPLANLDAALRIHTRSELAILQRRLGTTTIFVTHDQAEAMALSDRIAVMFAGQIRQIATPDVLYRNPADLDVARFLSQPMLNTLEARCIVAGRVLVAGEALALRDARDPGMEGTLGFRPEHGRLSSQPLPGALPVAVERSEHAGSEAHVFVRLADSGVGCVVRIASADMALWPAGTRGWLAVDAAEAWFFPRGGAARSAARPLASAVA